MWTVVPFIALWVVGGYYIYKVYPYGSYHISDSEKLLLSVVLLLWPVILPIVMLYLVGADKSDRVVNWVYCVSSVINLIVLGVCLYEYFTGVVGIVDISFFIVCWTVWLFVVLVLFIKMTKRGKK